MSGKFNIFARISERVRVMAEQNERLARYSAMSVEELRQLSDDELYNAVSARIDNIIMSKNELSDALKQFTGEQIIFYIAQTYMLQLEKGGLWQYLADSSHKFASSLCSALHEIGAFEHMELFETFIENNNIDVNNISYFSTFELRKFETMTDNPFKRFDSEYIKLKPVSEYLSDYIRGRADAF